ncbi:DUF2891 domain-containing protein [Chitinophaga lutea]|uniref:DUF2891 domain-containing protein n=1 Tax=Chitinophaga lutea TaxID=2488634 RepID=A0A3N4Q0F5_9BACT|nr:DUF2891 domain-containing protein [Chitinophaga lutea]RPE13698.1 DUF2891 domain-containing protein [Chitinophaga lutea]
MRVLSLLVCLLWYSNGFAQMSLYTEKDGQMRLTTAGALHFAALPLKCMQHAFPYKTGIVFSDSSYLKAPQTYHPAFYGCYDWHSSVHGHWMLVRLLKMYPDLPNAAEIRQKLAENLSQENIRQEMLLFRNKENKGFERIYGWSWLMQLQTELITWDDPLGRQLRQNIAPLAWHFSNAWRDFLKKIVYPIRVGEHTNLAFGLRLAWDYGMVTRDTALQSAIREAAMRFYAKDRNCPASWEPGGYDFLSPCLEEADLMWRILPAATYKTWVKEFLPGLFEKDPQLFSIAAVKDRTDGKLVHLDGLNLSRAWCLYGIARQVGENGNAIRELANRHLHAALPHVASGDYAGEHWLATFAVYALTVEY